MLSTEEKKEKLFKVEGMDPLYNYYPKSRELYGEHIYTADEIIRFYASLCIDDEHIVLENAIRFLNENYDTQIKAVYN